MADTEAPEGGQPPVRGLFFKVFPSICLPMFMAAVDQTIVATALPAIAASVSDVERISWIVVAYLMAATIAAPVFGRLGDALGRKRMMFVSLGVFMAASVLCALAPTLLALVGARLLQGFGGGGLMTMSQALIGESVPPRERARYQGYLATIFMLSSTIGPVLGGWLTQQFGWHSVFLINLPLGAAAVALAFRLPDHLPGQSRLRFDWLGLGLFTGFVVPLLLALERVQHASWAVAPAIAALLAVSVASLVLLLRQERRFNQPLIPVNLLRLPAIWRADAMGACVGATIVSAVTFMPIYLTVVRGVDAGQAGLLMLPLTAGVATGSLLTGRMIARTGRTAVFPSVGLAIVTGALLVLAAGAGSIPTGWLPLLFLVLSMSLGTTMPVVQTTVQLVAGPKHLGAASASVQFSRSIGAALGTALVGAVLFAVLATQDANAAELFSAIVERGPAVLDTLNAARRAVVSREIAGAFTAAFTAIACFSATGLVLAWTLPVRTLDG